MKKTIYWSVERKNGHANYYFDKNKMLSDWGNAKHLLSSIEKFGIVFYSLDTAITDDLILSLLNGEFRHNMLPDYRKAKLINIEE